MKLNLVSVMAALGLLSALAILSLAGKTAAIEFTDVAQRAGIRAELRCGGPEKRWIPEANGTGAAWLDYDNDGLMDLLIVNGSSMEQLRRIVAGHAPEPGRNGVYLFPQLGDGKFRGVSGAPRFTERYW